MTQRQIIAVVAAGVLAAVIDNAAAAFLFGLDFAALSQTYGRYAVAVGLAALLPFLGRAAPDPAAFVLSVAVLAVAAATLAKLAFGYGAAWSTVLILTTVYGLAATILYRLIAGRAALR